MFASIWYCYLLDVSWVSNRVTINFPLPLDIPLNYIVASPPELRSITLPELAELTGVEDLSSPQLVVEFVLQQFLLQVNLGRQHMIVFIDFTHFTFVIYVDSPFTTLLRTPPRCSSITNYSIKSVDKSIMMLMYTILSDNKSIDQLFTRNSSN